MRNRSYRRYRNAMLGAYLVIFIILATREYSGKIDQIGQDEIKEESKPAMREPIPIPVHSRPRSVPNDPVDLETVRILTNASSDLEIDASAVRDPVLSDSIQFKDHTAINFTIFENPKFLMDACSGTDGVSPLKTVILINSMPEDFEIRRAIRETWAAASNSSVGSAFVIGVNSTSQSDTEQALSEEIETFQDILLTDIEEHFYNLTLKTFLMFYWTEKYCSEVPFLLKMDSDVILFLDNLGKTDQIIPGEEGPQGSIWGRCWLNAAVIRDEKDMKRHVPETMYPSKSYPKYCSGTSYLVSRKARHNILKQIPTERWDENWHRSFPEDVLFTGILARKAGVTRRNREGINFMKVTKFDPCSISSRVTSHGFKTAEELREGWEFFEQEKLHTNLTNIDCTRIRKTFKKAPPKVVKFRTLR